MIDKQSQHSCTLCPRECGVNRYKATGYCHCGSTPLISSIFPHRGEEPVLSGTMGICNVFFAHCNMQCIYCQNHQISRNELFEKSWAMSIDRAVGKVIQQLDRGIRLLGFVSPSHQVYQMVEMIDRLNRKGYRPTIVYNSNGYDKVETLKELEGIVDVYLPDFKYHSDQLGQKYSDASDYLGVATKALREMYRQKGNVLILGEDNLAESGIIVRHLVLPGHANDSIKILENIAVEVSSNLHISLMSQYYPTAHTQGFSPLNRYLQPEEYNKVVKRYQELGFRGWIQRMDSSGYYNPDFSRKTPFID